MIIMFRTVKADWYFIISATLVCISTLVVTTWYFIQFFRRQFKKWQEDVVLVLNSLNYLN